MQEKETFKGHNQGLSLQNQDVFSNFKNERRGPPLPSSCVPLSVAENASISLNVPIYP